MRSEQLQALRLRDALQIELRITGALRTKAKKFAGYPEQGIVGEKDSCVVAGTTALATCRPGRKDALGRTKDRPKGEDTMQSNQVP